MAPVNFSRNGSMLAGQCPVDKLSTRRGWIVDERKPRNGGRRDPFGNWARNLTESTEGHLATPEKKRKTQNLKPHPLEGLSDLGNSPRLIRSHSPWTDRGHADIAPPPRQATLEFERDSHDLSSQ
ncbi:uncharacterized protein CLUP02_10613 [Colletotrichum lupini]|uniref:Uncharacterized protein n=1 Tax=Colletotrichum lupini TaxID=145971 RepID=A0A9Q8WJI7_9PEZI|nr:uncharacterized protein CLUP02_10613 [Colletotrichum lupini]UQC85117.1 hypothetical protein CLUP02_10613 [Colletotrichum lupini]